MADYVTNAGLDWLRDQLNAASGAYVAVGTGTQGTPATATKLAAEVFRKPWTATANGAAHGEALITAVLGPNDTPGVTITEVGWFVNGSATKDSGRMLFYSTTSHLHTTSENWNLQADSTM